nr:MAG TPA: hypothetical protein [Caudoviricetes sp.]
MREIQGFFFLLFLFCTCGNLCACVGIERCHGGTVGIGERGSQEQCSAYHAGSRTGLFRLRGERQTHID